MRSVRCLLFAGMCLGLSLSACRLAPAPDQSPEAAVSSAEQSIRRIPISGPMADADAEISGLSWQDNQLIFLPQYPLHRTDHRGRVFALTRAQIEAVLADSLAPPLTPREIPLFADGLGDQTPHYQGCEAIAFHGQRAYVVVEATADTSMRSYVVSGALTSMQDTIRMDVQTATPIPLPTHISNMSFESLLTVGDTLVTLYEANGANVNPKPRAERFTTGLEPMTALPFPTVEYRITDATAADSSGRFWAINYFYPGDRNRLAPAFDSLALQHDTGATHRQSEVVERLAEFQYTPTGIRRTERPPILLKLKKNDARNWEGIARLGDRGFILATDKFPETIVAFVPFPDEQPVHSSTAPSTYSRPAISTTRGR